MKAYHNNEALKIETINAMQADIKADRLVKGSYWNKTKGNGCFVGCVIRGNEHSKFETVLGIPRILAKLGDRIFEGLPFKDAKKFTIDFLFAINAGADLSMVWPKLAHFILLDPEHGVLKFAKTERVKKAIQAVGDIYQRKINGESIDTNTWLEARGNAADAYAADAADAAAAYTAYAAADAAADAAYAAADAAADAAYADADADAYAAYAAAYADAYAAYADADADAYAAYAAAYADAYAAYADAYAAYAAADADAYAAYAARSRHFVALAAAFIRFLGEAK